MRPQKDYQKDYRIDYGKWQIFQLTKQCYDMFRISKSEMQFLESSSP